jgi:hypothetical protein
MGASLAGGGGKLADWVSLTLAKLPAGSCPITVDGAWQPHVDTRDELVPKKQAPTSYRTGSSLHQRTDDNSHQHLLNTVGS